MVLKKIRKKEWIMTCVAFITLYGQAWSQTDSSVYVHPLVDSIAGESEMFSCILILEDQDVEFKVPVDLPKDDKARRMYDDLTALASTSQKKLLDSLVAWGISHRSFYIVNAIQATLDSTSLDKLRFRTDISTILPDFPLTTPPVSNGSGTVRRIDTLLNWAITHIGADSVWRMGITGSNVVIAGLDTGVEWDHPFLKASYRGTISDSQIDHDYNWHDGINEINSLNQDSIISPSNNPCGLSSLVPCDDHGHGTLTTGLITGQDDAQHIGIAPGARWMGSRVMERGKGLLSTYLSGLEWCMAPTDVQGKNPRPDLSPDIINNSWGCPTIEGCIPANYWLLDSATARLTRSGILVIASAGNNGRSGCGSIQSPLAIFSSVLTVGATNRRDSIAAFSSRGPVESGGQIKPELVAPGQEVTSIYPNGKFPNSNGTSISAPITAGVAALMLEANPKLRGRPDLIRDILIQSAVPILENPCTDAQQPNPVYGYGRIDALGAVRMAQEYLPTATDFEESYAAVKIFPNPVQDVFHVTNESNRSIEISVFNTQGGLMTSTIIPARGHQEVMASGFSPGLYIVHILIGNRAQVQKLIKF